MAASMKMTVFWDVVPCSLAETDRSFRDAYCIHHQSSSDKTLSDQFLCRNPLVRARLTHRPDDVRSKHLRNIGQFLPGYTAQHPRGQSSSKFEPLLKLKHN
jgi:hypothetical protein